MNSKFRIISGLCVVVILSCILGCQTGIANKQKSATVVQGKQNVPVASKAVAHTNAVKTSVAPVNK